MLPSPLTSNFLIQMELTKEYFDQALKAAVAPLATKVDVSESVEQLARIVADTIATPFSKRFDRLEDLLKVKDDVDTLKQQMAELRAALHLSV
jgi:hypothetical protein